ncbi:MAG: cellulase family glycosylhydrolase [Ruminococcus sp.]|nr:cellulase family glycosylhydrolase [Ruminococcus sp.]
MRIKTKAISAVMAAALVLGSGAFAASPLLAAAEGNDTSSANITLKNIADTQNDWIGNLFYTGSAIKPTVTLHDYSANYILKEGTDYTLTFKNNISAGTATATVTGKGSYQGTKTITFDIAKYPFYQGVEISTSKASYGYTGKEVHPSVTVKANGKTLKRGTDYTVSYQNCINIGTGQIVVTGIGNYDGSSQTNFTITQNSISNDTLTLPKSSYAYTGKAVKPAPTVTADGKKLIKDTDYTVSYSKNKNVGTAKVTVKGIGSYKGKLTKTFTITKKSISVLKPVTKKTSYAYTGKAIKPAVTVKNGKTTLKKGTDYTLSYKNNKKIGKATVTVKGKGNYKGSCKCTFKIVPKKVTGANAAAKGNTKAKLSWKKVGNASGYAVYKYNTSKKKYVKIKTIGSKNTTSLTVKGLKPGSSYKFKVRAYKKVGKKTYNGALSAVIKFKCPESGTPVAAHGRLKVKGANIVDKNGSKFQIIGMSTHGLMWEDFSDITSKASLKVLRDDWGINTIRLAMYTEEYGGYTTGADFKAQAKQKVIDGVKNATDLGLYAIIDWHILKDGDPRTHQSEAVAFFTEMAKKYSSQNNVIYEICNEPNGSVTWSGGIKSYCNAVVSAIRKYDKNAIIVCGTGTWSQDIDQVVGNRVDDKNCVYTLHFYANTHTDWLRNRVTDCYSKGLPILVTEFGTCDASGDTGFNASQTRAWLSLLDSKMIGYCNWSACGKPETASAFKSGTNLKAISKGTSQLTESGKLIRELYKKRTGK